MIADRPYNCGHPRGGDNDIWFGPGRKSRRCRQCHRENNRIKTTAGRGALNLVIRMHVEGALSEGQVAAATGLDRVLIRTLADSCRLAQRPPHQRPDGQRAETAGEIVQHGKADSHD